jgi:hypothetical protein
VYRAANFLIKQQIVAVAADAEIGPYAEFADALGPFVHGNETPEKAYELYHHLKKRKHPQLIPHPF